MNRVDGRTSGGRLTWQPAACFERVSFEQKIGGFTHKETVWQRMVARLRQKATTGEWKWKVNAYIIRNTAGFIP